MLLPELQTRLQPFLLQVKAVKSLWNQSFGAAWLNDPSAPSSDMDVPHIVQAGHPSPAGTRHGCSCRGAGTALPNHSWTTSVSSSPGLQNFCFPLFHLLGDSQGAHAGL